MIGICGEPQCLCKQVITPAPVALKAPAEDPRLMSDHELRWALRDGISVMYRHLGLCLGDGSCTNPTCPTHGLKEEE